MKKKWQFEWKRAGEKAWDDGGLWYAQFPSAMWEPNSPRLSYVFVTWSSDGRATVVTGVDEAKAQSIINGRSALHTQFKNHNYQSKFYRNVKDEAHAQRVAEKLSKQHMPYEYFDVNEATGQEGITMTKETLKEAVSRKHFRMVADTVKAIGDPAKRLEMAHLHAKSFAAANPRFDHEKFFTACNVPVEKIKIKEDDESGSDVEWTLSKRDDHYAIKANFLGEDIVIQPAYGGGITYVAHIGEMIVNYGWTDLEKVKLHALKLVEEEANSFFMPHLVNVYRKGNSRVHVWQTSEGGHSYELEHSDHKHIHQSSHKIEHSTDSFEQVHAHLKGQGFSPSYEPKSYHEGTVDDEAKAILAEFVDDGEGIYTVKHAGAVKHTTLFKHSAVDFARKLQKESGVAPEIYHRGVGGSYGHSYGKIEQKIDYQTEGKFPLNDSQRIAYKAVFKERVDEKKETSHSVRSILSGVADGVGKNKDGNYVARRGYFYRSGMTSEKFAEHVSKALTHHGIKHEIVTHGDHWTPFRGGSSLANSSHFYAHVKLHDAEPKTEAFALGSGMNKAARAADTEQSDREHIAQRQKRERENKQGKSTKEPAQKVQEAKDPKVLRRDKDNYGNSLKTVKHPTQESWKAAVGKHGYAVQWKNGVPHAYDGNPAMGKTKACMGWFHDKNNNQLDEPDADDKKKNEAYEQGPAVPGTFGAPMSEFDSTRGYVVGAYLMQGKLVKLVRMGNMLAPVKVTIDHEDWKDADGNILKFNGANAARDAIQKVFDAAQSGKGGKYPKDEVEPEPENPNQDQQVAAAGE